MRRRRRLYEVGQSTPRGQVEPGREEDTGQHHGGNQQEAMFHLPMWSGAQHQRQTADWNQPEALDPRHNAETDESWFGGTYMSRHNHTSRQLTESFASDMSRGPEIAGFSFPPAMPNPMGWNHQMEIDATAQYSYRQGSVPPTQHSLNVSFANNVEVVPDLYMEEAKQPQSEVYHGDWMYTAPPATPIQSPTIYQNQTATTLEIAESFESQSTHGPSFSPPSGVNQFLLNSHRNDAPDATGIDPSNSKEQLFCSVIKDNPEDRNEENEYKSPLPQNLRGDPFRSAKVKTELCRHFNKEGGCPFGDKCNYAHGQEELKYKKLMDLEREGQTDIEIFRTHVCPTWVATGACPFDQRCTGIHDPRIIGSESSWLPHAETSVNSIGTSVNVDKLYHQQLAAVYSCSPIHGYIPPEKWKADEMSTISAWTHFYAFVCDIDSKSVFSTKILSTVFNYKHRLWGETFPVRSTGKNKSDENVVSELEGMLIALKMREQKLGQCYAYLPTHLFCGELCMVLQTRFFRAQRKDCQATIIEELENNVDQASNDTITAHEIVFGAISDPSTRQHSVWFNIPKDSLVKCTPQQAKRHKRSRHRLKKNRSGKLKSPAKIIDNSPKKGDNTLEERTIDSLTTLSRNIHQPIDSAAFDLITDIMHHYTRVLECVLRNNGSEIPHNELNLLKKEQKRLRDDFESQRRHWMMWSWPVNMESFEINNEKDIPPINMPYRFDLDSDDYLQSKYFHGINNRKRPDILSYSSRLTVGFLWKSFIINMQLIRGQIPRVSQTSMPSHDIKFYNLHRLPIFRSLSQGLETRTLDR